MRMIQRNKIAMKYALLEDIVPIYQTDDEGNVIYDEIDGEQVPRETGKTRSRYKPAVDFAANVNFSGQSEIRNTVYGLSKSQYDAIFYTMRDEYPLDETTILFINATPEVDDEGYVKLESADYRVVRVIKSINYNTYLIRNVERAENDGS